MLMFAVGQYVSMPVDTVLYADRLMSMLQYRM